MRFIIFSGKKQQDPILKISPQKLALHWNSMYLSWKAKNIYFSVLILSVKSYAVYRAAKWLNQPETVYSIEIY